MGIVAVYRSDATCIICREEMATAKKLLCGHLFHVHCLRSWLERQNTCPTCRALVDPSENRPSGFSHLAGKVLVILFSNSLIGLSQCQSFRVGCACVFLS